MENTLQSPVIAEVFRKSANSAGNLKWKTTGDVCLSTVTCVLLSFWHILYFLLRISRRSSAVRFKPISNVQQPFNLIFHEEKKNAFWIIKINSFIVKVFSLPWKVVQIVIFPLWRLSEAGRRGIRWYTDCFSHSHFGSHLLMGHCAISPQ